MSGLYIIIHSIIILVIKTMINTAIWLDHHCQDLNLSLNQSSMKTNSRKFMKILGGLDSWTFLAIFICVWAVDHRDNH